MKVFISSILVWLGTINIRNCHINIQSIGASLLPVVHENTPSTSWNKTLCVKWPPWRLWLDESSKSVDQIPSWLKLWSGPERLFSEWSPSCRDDDCHCPAHACSRPAQSLFDLDETACTRLSLLLLTVLTRKKQRHAVNQGTSKLIGNSMVRCRWCCWHVLVHCGSIEDFRWLGCCPRNRTVLCFLCASFLSHSNMIC